MKNFLIEYRETTYSYVEVRGEDWMDAFTKFEEWWNTEEGIEALKDGVAASNIKKRCFLSGNEFTEADADAPEFRVYAKRPQISLSEAAEKCRAEATVLE